MGFHGVPPEVIKQFWSQVYKLPSYFCWLWQGERVFEGYGIFRIQGDWWIRAHRFSLCIASNIPPPFKRGSKREDGEGMASAFEMACHKCDNPPCVRPDHLFAGTSSDNRVGIVEKRHTTILEPRFHSRQLLPLDEEVITAIATQTDVSADDIEQMHGIPAITVRIIRASFGTEPLPGLSAGIFKRRLGVA